MRRLRWLLVAAAMACSSQPTPRPDDMSAAAHKAEADRERQEAQDRLAAHRERVAAIDSTLPGELAGTLPSEEMGPGGHVFHPSGGTPDLYAAEAHAAHAKQHEAAAAELERFEAAECKAIPPAERAACPMLTGAGAVADVQGGVELRFRPGSPVDDVERRMRCHFAYARAHGFADATECPLYVKGIQIQREGKQIIRITAPDAPTQAELRRRAREQVRPGAVSTPTT